MSSKMYTLPEHKIAVAFSDGWRGEPETVAVLNSIGAETKSVRTAQGMRWMHVTHEMHRERLLAAFARDNANRAPAVAAPAPAPKPAAPAPVARQYLSRADREEAREQRELAEIAYYNDHKAEIDAADATKPMTDAQRAYRDQVRARHAARERELEAQRQDTIARFARCGK